MKKEREREIERDAEPEGARSVKYLPLRVHSVPITSTESGAEMTGLHAETCGTAIRNKTSILRGRGTFINQDVTLHWQINKELKNPKPIFVSFGLHEDTGRLPPHDRQKTYEALT